MAGYDITEGVRFNLAHPVATSYAPSGAAWDIAISGLPFNLAVAKDRPLQRETAQFRTDRVDQEREPGEHSLNPSIWTRSVSSLHYGAGQRAVESLEVADSIARFRFYRSASINSWTPGQISLGNFWGTSRTSTATVQNVLGIGSGDYIHSADAVLERVQSSTAVTAITWGGATSIASICTDGTNWYASSSADGIYKGALPTGAGAKIWNTGAAPVIRWVKQRLMAGIGRNLYELDSAGSGGPALPGTLGTAGYLFQHPNASWTWTDIADGPSSIYFAGNAGEQSAIYRSTVTPAASGLVSISTPVVVAEMPRGEIVRSIYSYLGNYLMVGTSAGSRVAQINSDGSLTMGPQIISCAGGVYDHVGIGRYVYVTGGTDTTDLNAGSGAGAYRIDLGAEVETLRFAYAQEYCIGTSTSPPSSITASGGQIVLATPTKNVYVGNPGGTPPTEGWVEYGRISFSTLEKKAWISTVLRADIPTGASVEVYASTTGTGTPSTWSKIGTATNTDSQFEFSLAVPAPQGTRDMYVAIRLLRGSSSTSPVVYGIQVRAVPAPVRTRLVQLPLLCLDLEKDRNGVVRGYTGGAAARLDALEGLEDSGQVVTYQDFTTGERRSAVIDRVTFTRTAPPSGAKDNGGGVLDVLLRLL